MYSCCPVCYRVGVWGTSTNKLRKNEHEQIEEKRNVVEKRFFQLFQRYLNGHGCDLTTLLLQDNPIGSKITACEECVKLMESFCHHYNQRQVAELHLNWKVGTLLSVMKTAQRQPSRVKGFREFWGDKEESGPVIMYAAESFIEMKKSLVVKGSRKIANAFPKLSIAKWKAPPKPDGKIPTSSYVKPIGEPLLTHETIQPPKQNQGSNLTGTNTDGNVITNDKITFKLDQAPEVTTEKNDNNNQLEEQCKVISTAVVFYEDEEEVGSMLSSTSSSSDEEDSQFDFGEVPTQTDDDKSTDDEESKPLELVILPTTSDLGDDDDTFDNEAVPKQHLDSDIIKNVKLIIPDSSSSTTNVKIVPKKKMDQEKVTSFRLKCPDCNRLFQDVKDLLIHRKTLESSYDPDKSVKVQFLTSGGDPDKTGVDDDADVFSKYSTPLFTVHLPQKIFVCEICDRTAYSKEDMEAHRKLHGTFPCTFCDFEASYAPTLSMHELQHSEKPSGRGKHGLYISHNCSHCDFSCKEAFLYEKHHLGVHLSLELKDLRRCPICNSSETKTKRAFAEHFKSNHDLRGTKKESDLKRCKFANCPAYFLTDRQLGIHSRYYHSQRRRLKPARPAIKCKACGKRCSSLIQLGLHWPANCPNPGKESKHDGVPQQDVIHSRRKGLRGRSQRCPKCTKSFSSPEQYKLHQLGHSAIEINFKAEDDGSKGNDEDAMSSLEEAGTPPETPATAVVDDGKEEPSKKQRQPFRLKCPDCDHLSRDMKDLLSHRQTLACCRDGYDPNLSIKVEVRLLSSEKDSNLFDKTSAIVEVPQFIFLCEACGLALYSPEDMEAHKKLHGSFRCNFCNMEFSYALNLCYHELKRHARQKRKRDKRGEFSKESCPRCDFKWVRRGHDRMYVRHYFAAHLNQPPFNEPQCAICKTDKKDMNKWELGRHLKDYHDLSNVLPEGDIKRCDWEEGCPAYFLTGMQLAGHLSHRHGVSKQDANNIRRKKFRNECKDCGTCFADIHGLRKASFAAAR